MKKQRFTSGAGLLSVPPNCKAPSRPHSAFTLAEVMVSVALLGIGLVSLYGGFSSGFAIVRLNRENLRGTQILEEKMEMIRLYNWDQVINQPAINYLPANFTAPFYATNSADSLASGFLYTGKVTIAVAPIEESYAQKLRLVKIELTWNSGNVQRKREMSTFVSQYGLQNYLY